MITNLQNTLYVQVPNAYIRLDHDTLRVEVEGEQVLHVPLIHLCGLVLYGDVMISPMAMQRCVQEGMEISFLDFSGRFRCRVVGPAHGNILLRMAQYDAQRDVAKQLQIAGHITAGKIRNSRRMLIRAAREAKTESLRGGFISVAAQLAMSLEAVPAAANLDALRGLEGDASARYWGVFGRMILVEPSQFAFVNRTRRPPKDRVNALLSFLYAVLAHDCTSALETVGLDPQCGILHALRSGRPALALDLMEEFRACMVDRLVLRLINRRQVRPEHFQTRDDAGDSILLTEEGRKLVIGAYQERKDESVRHRLLKQPVPLGMCPLLQARLLARHLRGDVPHYLPFLFEA